MRYTGFCQVVLGLLVGGFCLAAYAAGADEPGRDLPGLVLLLGLGVGVALVGAGVGALASGRKGYPKSPGAAAPPAGRDGTRSGRPDGERTAVPSAGHGSGEPVPAADPRG